MTPPDADGPLAQRLERLLRRFDDGSKTQLAQRLVEALGLEAGSDPFPDQVERLLGRRLAAGERFRLEVLDQIHNLHCEEEEEEEE